MVTVRTKLHALRGTDYNAKTQYHVFITSLTAVNSFTQHMVIPIKTMLMRFKYTNKLLKLN